MKKQLRAPSFAPMPMTEPAASALLPAGMIDVLPPRAAFEAAAVERLMGHIAGFGYERVKPPLIEFEETLLAGAGAALAQETFRLMDPVGRRMLALRPDMTMQVARIAAMRLGHRPRPLRLAYAGQVVRVRGTQVHPERQFGQVGAELVGSPAATADVEVILLATTALAAIGVTGLTVDLNLPTLVPAILGDHALDDALEARLRMALDRKDAAAVGMLASSLGAGAALLARLVATAGPARPALAALAAADVPPAAAAERAALVAVHDGLMAADPNLTVTVDSIESRGFEYHRGVTFSLFARGVVGEIGRGGRYRTVSGEPATGVSLSMDAVLGALPPPSEPVRLFLPFGTPAAEAIRMRDNGWRAVAGLEPVDDLVAEAQRLGCSHVLQDGTVRAINTAPAA